MDRPSVLEAALEQRVVDDTLARRGWTRHIAEREDALVVLALPVDGIERQLSPLARALEARHPSACPLVLDVGSVKAPIVEAAERVGLPRFVGGHPMAGRARGGVAQADATLFDGRRFVLCLPAGTASTDRRAAHQLVEGLGAEPLVLDPAIHDRCVAMVSHAPHVVALAWMDAAARLQSRLPAAARRADLPWRLAAGAWRDATRVAAADPALWQAILTSNRGPIVETLDALITTLAGFRDSLQRGEEDLLFDGDGGVDARELARTRRRIERYLP